MRNNRIKRSNQSRIESVVILNSESYHGIEVSEAVVVLNDHHCTRYRLIWLLIHFLKIVWEQKNSRANMEKWPYSRANFQKFLFKIFAREYSHFANIRARIFKNLRFFDGFQRTLRMWWRGDSMRGNFFFSFIWLVLTIPELILLRKLEFVSGSFLQKCTSSLRRMSKNMRIFRWSFLIHSMEKLQWP